MLPGLCWATVGEGEPQPWHGQTWGGDTWQIGSQAGWGAWLACSWARPKGLISVDTGFLSFAMGSEAAQGPD